MRVYQFHHFGVGIGREVFVPVIRHEKNIFDIEEHSVFLAMWQAGDRQPVENQPELMKVLSIDEFDQSVNPAPLVMKTIASSTVFSAFRQNKSKYIILQQVVLGQSRASFNPNAPSGRTNEFEI